MKELLYYQDVMLREFEATIVSKGTDEVGRHYVVLSNTAFYPTGGGQPHDTGTLDAIEVLDVEKINDEIRHYIQGDPSTLDGVVHGKLNWARRFDHMQQHAGQHILTAAFVELFNAQTVSFHLGSEHVTIDIATDTLTEQQLAAAEARANDIILENRPIQTTWITENELANYNLRKEVAVTGDIRLVIIPDFDYNGCGGTHPVSTGQVSAIKILGTEKMKGNVRVSFVCGQRVLSELAMRKEVLADVARQLSVPEVEAATALSKILVSQKNTEKALAAAKEELLAYEVKALVAGNEDVVAAAFNQRTMQELQKIARIIVIDNPDVTALLASENEGKLQFVAAKGKNVAKSMKVIAEKVLPLINGKGGGSDQMVQGGGECTISKEELLEVLQNAESHY
ncbi:DHHA1 domain-containing protein [Lysinibacillus irui]|uniref:DHHA1 domain-containing protein n=1 Tax=Lysinibacillus irui TaxID=2998077 RepID=A0ABU5NMW9_9BACI|nr:DHHA1 domain-containing protein [Lysinibacillus irui]MEA0556304.1 DHHA1 domain-containing protein [Lysinibacillus irui]MEA0977377.1 DHHA1 domain-containing protein [Lysinibacillus irui]MEA1043531.1 DHHA1 domain-containing protein [Lysinibacillus irui]